MTKRPHIVLAPFANERMREWPLANFDRLVRLGLADGHDFTVIGTLPQRALADAFVRDHPADRVRNLCGTVRWADVAAIIRDATCVVANNSGIAHLAAMEGARLLCVFGAKHSWLEWMPRGPNVTTLVRPPACSPCESSYCPNELACLAGIPGDHVHHEIARMVLAAEVPASLA